MKSYCVYRHISPFGKVYIGITSKKPEERWNHGRAYWQNKHFANAIALYGWDNFQHEIIFDGLDKETACRKERELIAFYRSNEFAYGYNRSTGGENPAEGMIVSEETRKKKSLALKGRTMPLHDRVAISNAKKGKRNGLEGRTGALCGKSGIVYQIDEASGTVVNTFYGYDEMNRQTGFKKTPVREAAIGMRKRAYGYVWKYENRGVANVAL